MGVILDFLKGLVSKTYRFFAPAVTATSTAVDESVIVEFARQSGRAVRTVTNGLGECVGYTATNAVVSNGESKVVGTVIDFASKQVVVTDELAASTAVAGGESVAVGSTVTEITATATTTTMLGTVITSAGALVLTAIAGVEVGKSIGNYLNEKYPNFWGDPCAKALKEAGCTLDSNGNWVITYMNSDGQTYVPNKAISVIKSELTKVGANIGGATTSYPYTGETVPIKVLLGLGNDSLTGTASEYPCNIFTNYATMPFMTYGFSNAYFLPKDVVRPCLYTTFFDNGTFSYSYMAKNYGGDGYNCFYAYINTSYNFGSQRYNIGFNSFSKLEWIHNCLVPIFADRTSAQNYLDTGTFADPSKVTIPDSFFIPATPVKVPTPKIIPDGTPDNDDEKALPVPGLDPESNPDDVPEPQVDPSGSSDRGVSDNPDPYPEPLPIHIPDFPDILPDPPADPIIAPIPDMVASAISRVFNPTQAELDALGAYLWSSSRLDDLLKLFQNPADGIISLHAIYGTPSIGADAEIKLGYLPTGVSAPVVTSQFVVINCGTITISEKYNNATDYAPYTTVQIYLPFIGIQTLNPFDVVGSSIKCTYKIDVYTGACIAQLNVERSGLNGVIYEFAGNCAYQIPLTSGNYVQAVANVIGGAVAGGVLGGPSGAALGAGQALLHSNVDVARSGNLSANAGILGNRIPYFIITRSIPHDALSYGKYYGFPANKTICLDDCSGFTRVKHIILHTSATQEERDEIMKLLKTGIYI